MRPQKHYKGIIFLLIAFLLLMTFTPLTTVFAEGVSYDKIVDPDTSDSYIGKLISDKNGSKNAGRIWADKSVYTDSATLDYETDGVDALISTDSDFLHAYSVLGSSQLVNDVVPLDVMFIMDISFSMSSTDTNDNSPAIVRTARALNNSINQLLTTNPNARFGIATYSSKAVVPLELGYYGLAQNQTAFVSVSPTGKYSDFTLTIRVHDMEADVDRTIKVSNNDMSSMELKAEGWDSVIRNYEDKDYIIDGNSTNVQSGIEVGLNELAKAKDTIYTTDMGNVVSRIPAMILLSDGSANTMADVTPVNSDIPLLPDHNFVDMNGATGSGDLNYTNFDAGKDFSHSNNYIPLYGFDKELNRYIDNTTIATVTIGSDDELKNLPENNTEDDVRIQNYDPVVLSTLLTASYYTSAVNNHYRNNAMSAQVTNLNNVSLKNYTIYAATSTKMSGSDINIDVVNKVMNPTQYFNENEEGGNAYAIYQNWLDSEDGSTSRSYNIYYLIADYYMAGLSEFYNSGGYAEYLERLKEYDPEKDGDYKTFDDNLYDSMIEECVKKLYGIPSTIRTKLTLNLSDQWLENPENNPYGVTPTEVKENIYYLPSKNALSVKFDDIEQVFNGIIDELTGNAFLLTSGMNSLGVDNAVTYMDPIGDYMNVTGGVTVDGAKTPSDMVLVLNGSIDPVVKTAVYDYQFNNAYVARIREERNDPTWSFEEGWYKGTDPDTTQFSVNGSWEDGYVYRVRYDTAISYIPTLKNLTDTNQDGQITADDISEKQKRTVYKIYDFDLPGDPLGEKKNSWRLNPAYLSSHVEISEDDLEKDTNIIKKEGMQAYYDAQAAANQRIPDGIFRLSDIRIWVEDTGYYLDTYSTDFLAGTGYSEALYVNVPASAVPTQIIELSFNEDEQTIKYETNLDRKNESTPLRLYYSVGVTDDIRTISNNGIDLSKVSKTYLDSHTTSDNQVYFLSNYYSAHGYEGYDPESKARTRGDPVLTFSPEIDNRYYVFQHYHILYTKIYQVNENKEVVDISDTLLESFQGSLKLEPFNAYEEAAAAVAEGKLEPGDYVLFKGDAARSFDPNINYFTILNQYQEDPDDPGTALPTMTVLLRSGKEFTLDNIENISLNNMICWYNPNAAEPEKKYSSFTPETLPEGYVLSTKPSSVRVGRMSQSIETKGENTGETYTTGNLTQTANNYFLPTLSSVSGVGDNILINIYLGNDGVIKVDNTLLFVTKLVADKNGNFASSDEQLAHKDFDYQIFFEGFNGQKSAIKVQWDEQFQMWRRRISTIDVITDNRHLLQTSDYKLVRVNEAGEVYDGTQPLKAYPYYVYIVNVLDSDIPGTGDSQIIRVYSAVDNDQGNAPSGTRERTNQGVYFNASRVLLVPAAEVNDNWTLTPEMESQYKALEDFPVATMEPHTIDGRTNGLDLSSPYLIKSEYLTQDLNFGLDSVNDLFDNQMITIADAHNTPKFLLQTSIKNNTAQFSLKHGEGLLFNGIPSGSYYRVTEHLSESNDTGWKFWDKNESVTPENADKALKVAVKHLLQDHFTNYDNHAQETDIYNFSSEDVLPDSEYSQLAEVSRASVYETPEDASYSITGETGRNEEGVQYVNTTETSGLTVAKNLSPDTNTEITDLDKNLYFNFDISLNYSVAYQQIDEFDKNSIRYKYAIYDTGEENNEETIENLKDPVITGYLVSNFGQMDEKQNTILANTTEDGESNNTWTIPLKHGQVLKVFDLLIGTEYSVTEEPTEGYEEVLSREHDGVIENDAENYLSNLVIITNKKVNPSSAYIELDGYKAIRSDARITPPELQGEDYSFTITPEEEFDSDPIQLPNTIVKNDENGKIVFFGQDQTYVKPGVYSYVIEESDDYFQTGIIRDLTQYRVVVTVEEEYEEADDVPHYTGRLKASYEVYKINSETEESWKGNAVEFINQYKPLPTTLSLNGSKTYLLGQLGDNLPERDLKYGDFYFRIAPATGSETVTPLPEKTVVPNNENGEFIFPDIRFTEPGTYKYVVSEVIPQQRDEYIIYDNSLYMVTVLVRDDEDNQGTLKAVATTEKINVSGEDQKAQELHFTNYHKSGDLTVEKTTSGLGADPNDEFSFRVDLSDNTINTPSESDDTIRFINGSALFTLKNGESKSATNLPAGITYTVEETDSKDYKSSYTSDNLESSLGSNNISGTLRVGSLNTVTVNNHKAGPVETTLSGLKSLENQNVYPENYRVLTGDQFSFILKRGQDNPETDPVPQEGLTVRNNSAGVFSFDLTYQEPGSYTYTLSEIQDNQPGFVYDDTRYQIDIEVTDDGKSDSLILSQSVHKTVNNTQNGSLAFTNVYSPAVTSITLEGDKEYNNGSLSGGDFDFLLTPTNDGPIPQSLNTTNDSLGHFSFGNIIFDHEGVFTYEITEINKTNYKVLYSDLIYEVTVTVIDNNGFLQAYVQYQVKDGQEVEAMVFTNTLQTGDLEVSKTVTGTGADLNQAFEFRVELDDPSINGQYGDMTFTNGVAKFALRDGETRRAEKLPVDTRYTVSEVDSKDYIVYKTGETGTIILDNVSEAKFINRRDAFGGIEVLKTVIGTLEDQAKAFDFTVTLYNDEAYTDVATQIHGTYGDMTFDMGVATISLKNSEKQTATDLPIGLYYVVEETGNTDYLVRSSGETGQITEDYISKVEFINERENAEVVAYPISVQKVIVGTPDEEAVFTFSLGLKSGDPDGVILPEEAKTSIKGAGFTNFAPLTFTKAGTYTFTVAEIDIPDGYRTDVPDKDITIVISEENKHLSVSQVQTDKGDQELLFTNYCEAQGKIEPNIGILKLHKKLGQEFTVDENRVAPGESITYKLSIKNTGNSTAHNLTVYDALPKTLEMMTNSSVYKSDDSENKDYINLLTDYNQNTNLILVKRIKDSAIDLDPGQELVIEYEAMVPTDVDQATYWTNHSWLTYDELERKYLSVSTKSVEPETETALMAFSLNQDPERLRNFTQIDTPIELEQVANDAPEYHSLLHSNTLFTQEIGTSHVMYSNDVREYYEPTSENHQVTPPPTPSTPQNTGESGTSTDITDDDPTDQKTETSDSNEPEHTPNRVESESASNGSITPATMTEDMPSNQMISQMNTVVTTNEYVTTSEVTTTGVSDAPKTGVESLNTAVWIIVILAVIGVFVSRMAFRKEKKN